MRDPARIDVICNKLKEAWKQDPDMRFTQLLSAMKINESQMEVLDNNDFKMVIKDNFFVEDNIVEAKIDMWIISTKKG